MPLNWTVTKCENALALLEGDEWTATEVLIFALGMLDCGGVVTEANAPEIYARLAAYETCEGALRSHLDESNTRVPVYFTPAEIRARVGLSTNWGPRKASRAAWCQRVLGSDSVVKDVTRYAGHYREAVTA